MTLSNILVWISQSSIMRLEDVSAFLAKSGVTTRTGKRISKTKASFILSNPFYIRLFKYGGEIHEGKARANHFKDWAEELNRLALQDYKNSAPSLTACVKEKEIKLSVISQKLERLLNGYLDQVIDEQDYRNQKAKLLSEKKSLEEEMASLSHKQDDWLAPFQNWLKDAQSLDKIASDSDLFAKKVCAKGIFGTHLLLGEKTVRASAPKILNSLAIPPKILGRRFAPSACIHRKNR